MSKKLKKILATIFSITLLSIIFDNNNINNINGIEPQASINSNNNQELIKRENLKKRRRRSRPRSRKNLENTQDTDSNNTDQENQVADKKIIKDITIIGNTLVPTDTLLIKIPYRIGQVFDPILTSQLIKNLYSLNYFDYIEVQTEDVSDREINLIILLKEKKKVESFLYEGNANLTPDEIEKKYKFSEIPAVNEEEVKLLAELIRKLYQEKNYHNVEITTELRETPNNTVIVVFKIKEGKKAIVKRVMFIGNKAFTGKKLRSMMFTREDWLLGAMDKSGTYDPMAIERDKQVVEYFYQSNGFLAARIVDVKVDINPETQCIDVTFIIDEGDIYTLRNISVTGNEILTEQQLLPMLSLRPGQLYSRELIRQNIEILRTAWGQFGYIYADIDPAVQPDFENKIVDITFNTDLGSQVFVNRINIIGNFKTRDYVIRRSIFINEGELVTTQAMDLSKNRVEAMGYFDNQDGANWKINRINENLADLDLILKEIKTGKLFGQVGFGGADIKSPATSLKVTAGVSDRNFLGTGIRYNLNLTYSQQDSGVLFNIFQPWLFNLPIGAGFDVYYRHTTYEDFKNVKDIPVEKVLGTIGQITFAPQRFPDLASIVNAGLEKIRYDHKVIVEVNTPNPEEKQLFQEIVNRRFEEGNLTWLGGITGQDLRNHPVYPSHGYNWTLSGKFGVPNPCSNFGFFKVDLDSTWITPLIGDSDLIFLLHGHVGFAKPFGGKNIPYRELYHIGGPATVRGFTYGQIGPQVFGDSIGAQKAFWLNAELIFSISRDQAIRGVLFYDGGAGWDTPQGARFVQLGVQDVLKNNKFNYRHAIGFGIRLANPPLRIDWGFKLDRNKRLGENVSEVHFNMSQDF